MEPEVMDGVHEVDLQSLAETKLKYKSEVNPMYLASLLYKDEDYLKTLTAAGMDINEICMDELAPLHLAASRGESAAVDTLLNVGAVVSKTDKAGNNALHHAVCNRHHQVVQLLIKRGVDKNGLDKRTNTALYQAALNDDSTTIRILLEAKCKIHEEVKSDSNNSQLHWAAKEKHSNLVASLRKADVDINGYVEDDMTSLHLLARAGDKNAVTILLDNLANPNVYCKNGFTPLFYASEYEHKEVASLLLSKTENIHRDSKKSLLHWAISYNKPKVARTLTSIGEDINQEATVKNESHIDGHTILHYETGISPREVIELCLELKANVNITDKNGKTPLYYAVKQNKVENVKLLLKWKANFIPVTEDMEPEVIDGVHEVDLQSLVETKLKYKSEINPMYLASLLYKDEAYLKTLTAAGMDINEICLDELAPLHLAANRGESAAVDTLLNVGAIVSKTDKAGNNSLHHAVCNRHHQVVELLIKRGVDKNALDKRTNTALYQATLNDDSTTIRILLEAKCKIQDEVKSDSNNSQLHWAAKEKHSNLVAALTKADVDINGYVEDGMTSLHLLARAGDENAVTILLDNFANPNVYCKNGFTPLFYASDYEHKEVARLLLPKTKNIHQGSKISQLHWAVTKYYPNVARTLTSIGQDSLNINQDVKIENESTIGGHTILHYEAGVSERAVVELCLELKADFNLRDKNGRTPLYYAVKQNKVDNVNLLLERKANFIPTSEYDRIPIDDDLKSAKGEPERPAYTSLHHPIYLAAALDDETAYVKTLGLAGLNINEECKDGLTPLQVAAKKGELKILKTLIENNAGINNQDQKKRTALHHAVLKNHCEIISFLTENGADTDVIDSEEKTALFYAAEKNLKDCVRVLLNKRSRINANIMDTKNIAQLHWAAKYNHPNIASALKKAGVDINEYVQGSMTSLHILSEDMNIEGVNILLNNDADIHKCSKEQFTALYYASKGESENAVEIVKTYLSRGARRMSETGPANPIHWAVLNCKNKMVQNLLDAGLKIDDFIEPSMAEIPTINSTVLHLVTRSDNTAAIKLCIEKNAKLNLYDSDQKTALYYAVTQKNIDGVKALLDNGALFACKAEEETLWLEGHIYIAAVLYQSADMVDVLRRAGAKVATRDKNGKTALHLACAEGESKAVDILLDAGAKVNEADKNGFQALHHGVSSGNLGIVKSLCSRSADLIAADKEGKTPLHHASTLCEIEMVKHLITVGTPVNVSFKDGNKERTPLYEVLKDVEKDEEKRNEKISVAQFLIKEEGKVDKNEEDNLLHYYWAAQNQENLLLKALTIVGQNINAKNRDGLTTLHFALKEYQPCDVLKRLIEHGADVNMQDSSGKTALHWVTSYTEETSESLKLICDSGAKINAVDKDKKTPLQHAAELNNDIVTRFLLKKGANFFYDGEIKEKDPPIYVAAKKGETAIVKALMKAGVKINNELKDLGLTPLQLACKEGHHQAVKTLIDAGADVDKKNNDGLAALHVCSQFSYLCENSQDIMAALLDGKADINSIDEDENTALHNVLKCLEESEPKYPPHKLLTLLLEKGASVTRRDKDGVAPLDLLIIHWEMMQSKNRLESSLCVKLLFEAGGYITTIAMGKIEEMKGVNFIFTKKGSDLVYIDVQSRISPTNQTDIASWKKGEASAMIIGDTSQISFEVLKDHKTLSSLIVGNMSMDELVKILETKKVKDKLIVFNISSFDQERFMSYVGSDVLVLVVVGNDISMPLIIEKCLSASKTDNVTAHISSKFDIINVSHCKMIKLKRRKKSKKLKSIKEDAPSNTIQVNCDEARAIYLHNNNLISLTEEIGSISGLSVFAAHDNKLQRIPTTLGRRLHYNEFIIENNPIANIPNDILNEGVEATLSFLSEFATKETSPNTYVKLVLVGHEQVGKTTFIQALQGKPTTGIIKTDGIDISEIQFVRKVKEKSVGCLPSRKKKLSDCTPVTIKCFDFAGDVDFLETHALYITDDTLFLLVFDLSTFVENDSYQQGSMSHQLGRLCLWLETINAKAPNSRVILIGTHADHPKLKKSDFIHIWEQIDTFLKFSSKAHIEFHGNNLVVNCLMCQHNQVVRKTEMGVAGYAVVDPMKRPSPTSSDDESYHSTVRFPHIVGYYEVSSKKRLPNTLVGSKNLSIEQVRQAIHMEAMRFIDIQPTIPKLWATFQNVLKATSRRAEKEAKTPILLYDDYSAKAKEMAIHTKSLKNMTSYLHCQGDILHFSKCKSPKEDAVVVLNPQWLANNLKELISFSANRINNEGILTNELLQTVWKDLDATHKRALVQLFVEMKICIPVTPFTTGPIPSLLFPCKLPNGTPTLKEWNPYPLDNQPQLTKIVHLTFVPPPLFCDLIAKVDSHREDFMSAKTTYYKNHLIFTSESVPRSCQQCREDSSQSKRSLDFSPSGGNQSSPHRIHVECNYTKNSLILTARGKKACCFISQFQQYIYNLLENGDHNGLTWKTTIACPLCVIDGNPQPGEFLETTKTSVCKKDENHSFDKRSDVMQGYCSILARSVCMERQLVAGKDGDCPKLFTILPLRPDLPFCTLANTHVRDGFAVHFLCEYPDGWHFLVDEPGYHIDNAKLKDFVGKYGPRMCKVLKVMSDERYRSVQTGAHSELPPSYELCKRVLKQGRKKEQKFISDILEDFLKTYPELRVHIEKCQDIEKDLKQDKDLSLNNLNEVLGKIAEKGFFGPLDKVNVGADVLFLCKVHREQIK